MKDIIFTNTSAVKNIPEPKPSSQFIPQWYKDIDSYVTGKKIPNTKGSTSGTVKRCIPVFDAVTSGYIITSAADVYISLKGELPWYEWASLDLIEFHPVEQAPNHPKNTGFSYPKWMNPWSIETPKGYSVLVTQPMHHDLPFTILPGVVDTDTYHPPINFPFVMNDPDFEGVIPAGTPIAQIIPFKRESWKMSFGNEKNVKKQADQAAWVTTRFFDRYKNFFWHKKQYK